MEAEGVKQALCLLQERLRVYSMGLERCRELLLLRAVEAAGTDGGASGESTENGLADSRELLQQMDKNREALCDALRNLHSQEEQHFAYMRTRLQEDQRENEILYQQIKKLEEAMELEEACQQQRKKEAETPETAMPEVVEAQMERDLLAKRRGFCYWLQTFSLLFISLQVAIACSLAAAFLYASWYDPELFYRLLLRVLPEQTYINLAYVMGRLLPVVSEGLLPF